ncbi:MAG TPA: hypothetical protein VF212_06605 [Longimicrobiales bacterium]
MSHLTLEALARLVDEPPTAAEASHLEACAGCRRELDALIGQTVALRDLPDLLPPPADAWPALAGRLHREGLLSKGRRFRRPALPFARIAAAAVIFVVGGAAGFAARGGVDRSTLAAREPAAPPRSIQPVSDVEDAARRLAEAEASYRAALAQYTQLAGAEPGADPIARLAALDHIVLTTRQALREAPADPVINGYHLTALAQREATMKQLVRATDRIWY